MGIRVMTTYGDIDEFDDADDTTLLDNDLLLVSCEKKSIAIYASNGWLKAEFYNDDDKDKNDG